MHPPERISDKQLPRHVVDREDDGGFGIQVKRESVDPWAINWPCDSQAVTRAALAAQKR